MFRPRNARRSAPRLASTGSNSRSQPDLRHDDYAEIVARLKAAGRVYERSGKGSHEIWSSPINGRKVTVLRTRSRHLANSILCDAGVPHRS